MDVRDLPRTAKGAREFSPRPQISAPICFKGWITRDMGRALREVSPVTVKNLSEWDANNPNINRRVVPEFPAFNTSTGSRKLPNPIPFILTDIVFDIGVDIEVDSSLN